MAAFSHFPPHFVSLSSQYYQTNSFSFFYQSCFHLTRRHCNRKQFAVCFASVKKSRKLISDADLCNDLREFVASVGLPDGHVPSTKELTEHGRKDLANIVRRRGYKLIKELLANSSKTVTDGFDSRKTVNDELNEIHVHEETGQEEKVNDVIQKSVDIPLMIDAYDTGNSLVTKYESSVLSDDQSHTSIESPASLQEKLETFMKYGQLDTVGDDFLGSLISKGVKESVSSSSRDNSVEAEPVIQGEVDTTHLALVSNNNMGLNGTLRVPRLIDHPSMEENLTRNIYLPAQGQANASFQNNMNIEASEVENEVEVNRLKHMLHQKELELSRLKEEIEKEKQALSILQTKAENEISKAQKLISQKDAELHAAEESLSGLMEAKIEYSGEGQIVEVAGSFNGWHQKIKLDPQPSSDIMDPLASRKPRLWSTSLWLYPGVYEIKFIVDGKWQIDPHRESTIRGGIENNILRVDRWYGFDQVEWCLCS